MPTTTSSDRSAVVLLPFNFSDRSAAKLRPAVLAIHHLDVVRLAAFPLKSDPQLAARLQAAA
jgi:hypothetical protein